MPIQANQPTQAMAAPSRMQLPHAEVGHPVQKSSAKRVPGGTVSVVIVSCTHTETTLKGYHDEISQLGLERMLDLMDDHFFLPQMAVQAKEHVKKCHQCITFKAQWQRASMESIVATHALELVYINYLCLE